MKKLVVLFLLTAAVLGAQSEVVDLGSRGTLTFYLQDHWKAQSEDYGDRHRLEIVPKTDRINATCTVTIGFVEEDHFNTKLKLRQHVETDAQQMAEGSLEGKAVAREINVGGAYGYYCSFTDPNVNPKRPKKGEFRVISMGLIRLSPGVMVSFTILADDFRSEPYQQLLGAIEGMEYARPRGGR